MRAGHRQVFSGIAGPADGRRVTKGSTLKQTRVIAVGSAAVAALALVAGVAAFHPGKDFGISVQNDLNDRSQQLFGISGTLDAVSGQTVTTPGTAAAKLANSLKAELVTDQIKSPADMIAFWPDDASPQYTISCIEGPSSDSAHNGVQRVNIATGEVATILTGTGSCDGIRRTPWGTILATEERSDGNAIEIFDPIGTMDQTVDRTAHTSSSPNIVFRPALGNFAWEGIVILDDGTLYAGDENRPSSGKIGGTIYKFVPATPRSGSGDISDPALSPFVAGVLSALQLGDGSSFGQGANYGKGEWIGPIVAASARADAQAKGASGFWRPEDMDRDPLFGGGVRACFTATGNAATHLYGEVDCFTDAPSGPEVQPFVIGSPEFTMPDNVAFQPGTGILYVLEDIGGVNNFNDDVWACLPDGADGDILSDGCVRVAVNLDGAGTDGREGSEWTGMIFAADGKTAYIHMQHRSDPANPLQTRATDDEMRITGFKVGSFGGD